MGRRRTSARLGLSHTANLVMLYSVFSFSLHCWPRLQPANLLHWTTAFIRVILRLSSFDSTIRCPKSRLQLSFTDDPLPRLKLSSCFTAYSRNRPVKMVLGYNNLGRDNEGTPKTPNYGCWLWAGRRSQGSRLLRVLATFLEEMRRAQKTQREY